MAVGTGKRQWEPDDPWERVGVVVPQGPGEDASALMARTFVEEFALMGFSADRILRLFKSPFYAGPYAI